MLYIKRSMEIATLFLLMSCAGNPVRVNLEYDWDKDFSGLKTYRWFSGKQDGVVQGDLADGLITTAVEKELTAKGFVKREEGTPDFLVKYHAAVEGKLDAWTVNKHYHFGTNSWARDYYETTQTTGVKNKQREYEQGTLILDIIDGESLELFWRGTAQAEIDTRASESAKKKTVDRAVHQIMKQFPPFGRK